MSQGPTGIQGPQGIQGVKGDQGIQGPTGIQGQQGLQGPAGGPTGPLGPTGIQGQQGLQGPAGGPTGPSGPTGFNGTIGSTGPTGTTGNVPNLVVTGTTGTSLTLSTANDNQMFHLRNSGFNAITLPATTATSDGGGYWTLRNSTPSTMSITINNTLTLTSPLVLPGLSSATLVISPEAANTVLLF
jgi:hypothetical protein